MDGTCCASLRTALAEDHAFRQIAELRAQLLGVAPGNDQTQVVFGHFGAERAEGGKQGGKIFLRMIPRHAKKDERAFRKTELRPDRRVSVRGSGEANCIDRVGHDADLVPRDPEGDQLVRHLARESDEAAREGQFFADCRYDMGIVSARRQARDIIADRADQTWNAGVALPVGQNNPGRIKDEGMPDIESVFALQSGQSAAVEPEGKARVALEPVPALVRISRQLVGETPALRAKLAHAGARRDNGDMVPVGREARGEIVVKNLRARALRQEGRSENGDTQRIHESSVR